MATHAFNSGKQLMPVAPKLINKSDVCQMLGVSDRTLEKLVAACQFPPPLRLGKRVAWSEEAVFRWLNMSVQAQLTWQPPQRKARKRPE